MSSEMSPELDLLESLTGQDESLHFAWQVFSRSKEPDDESRERARKAVSVYVKLGYVQIVRVVKQTEVPVPDWDVRCILEDAASWKPPSRGSGQYRLHLTDEGNEAFVRDSAGFFDRLFGNQRDP